MVPKPALLAFPRIVGRIKVGHPDPVRCRSAGLPYPRCSTRNDAYPSEGAGNHRSSSHYPECHQTLISAQTSYGARLARAA